METFKRSGLSGALHRSRELSRDIGDRAKCGMPYNSLIQPVGATVRIQAELGETSMGTAECFG